MITLINLSNILGIVGVIITLFSYYLLSIGIWSGEGIRYQLCNLVGSILVLFSLYYHFNMSSALIEIAWIFISLIGLCRIWNLKF
jgi:hypothetical protein